MDEVTPNSVSLSWDKPTDTGGGKIEGYVVEMKDKDGQWKEVSPLVKDNKFKVPRLTEGESYQFRVKAVNEAGPGTPSSPTGLITAEKPAGLFFFSNLISCFLFFSNLKWILFIEKKISKNDL